MHIIQKSKNSGTIINKSLLKVRPLWRHYFKNTQALIYVIDSNDRERIESAGEELHRVLQEDELKDCAVLIMANKQDLPSAMNVAEVAEKIKFSDIKLKEKHIVGTVATTGDGLYEGLNWIHDALTKKDVKNEILTPLTETVDDARKLTQLSSQGSWSSYFKSYLSKFSIYQHQMI